MDQLFALQNEKSWKTLLTDGTIIRLVNEKYKTPEEFLEKYEEKGFMKKRLEISVLDIQKVTHPDKEANNATIEYTDRSSTTSLELEFDNYLERDQFVGLVSKTRRFTATTGSMGVFKAITPSLIGLGVTALLGFLVYIDAQALEAGEDVNTSGRRSLYKKLFAWLAEMLGTTGTLAVTGAIALLCIYFIYKNVKNPPSQVVYS
jgi:hypothetical protein